MTDQALEVTGGVDTYGETHHAAVVDLLGRHLADREFKATGAPDTGSFLPGCGLSAP